MYTKLVWIPSLLLLLLATRMAAIIDGRGRQAFSKLSSMIPKWNWLHVLGYTNNLIITYENIRDNVKIDLTAGASSISSPEYISYCSMNSLNLPILFTETNKTSDTSILAVHKLGKRVLRKIPDTALLGALVLIASEILQREIISNKLNLPPIFQEMANTTFYELDSKLEQLSSLQWNVDPFMQAEIENLQTQPFEVIDRFILKELLPRADKELSPLLSRLITDPAQVTELTKYIKKMIKNSNIIIHTDNNNRVSLSSIPSIPIHETTATFIEQVTVRVNEKVDSVGQNVEVAIKEWNMLISDVNKLFKSDTVKGLNEKYNGLFLSKNTTNKKE